MRKKGIFKKLFCMLLAAVLICTLTPPLTAAEKPAAGERQTIHREQPEDASGTEASEAARKETAAVTEAGKADNAEEPADSTPAAAEKEKQNVSEPSAKADGQRKEQQNNPKQQTAEQKAGSAKTRRKAVLQKAPGADREAGAASVNGKKYETLQAAIDAAEAGDTVLLTADRTENVKIGKAITLDLQGHTLKKSDGNTQEQTLLIEDAGGSVTVKNGTVSGGNTKYISSVGAVQITDTCVDFEDLNITGCTGNGYAVEVSAYSDLSGTIHFTNVSVSGNQTNAVRGGTKNAILFQNCRFDRNTPEHPGMLVTLGGTGDKTFDHCSFQHNSNVQGVTGTAGTYADCVIQNNATTDFGAVYDSRGWKYTFVRTVVKKNSCASKYGTAGVDVKSLELTDSAVYDNINSAGGRTDFGTALQKTDVTGMKDPLDPSRSFSDCGIDANGTVRRIVPVYEAEIGSIKYKTLKEALAAAKDGDTIRLIHTTETGDTREVSADQLWITKRITIDLNGRNISSESGWSFCLHGASADLTLTNSGEQEVSIQGSLYCDDKDSHLTIGGRMRVKNWIYPSGNTVIDGTHDTLKLYMDSKINSGKSLPVTLGKDFRYTGKEDGFQVRLAETADLNDPDKPVEDIVIARHADNTLADMVKLSAVKNPLVSASVENGNLVVHKDTADRIYLNGKDGDDTGDGSTKETAVKTFERAKALAESRKKAMILVTGTVAVDREAVWELAHPDRVTLYRDPEFSGHLVKVGTQGSLTLKNIVLDGSRKVADAGKNSLISVNGGKLTLEKGAYLQNNCLTDRTAYPPAAGGAIFAANHAAVTIDGGTVRGNTAVWGGGIFLQDSILDLKDGQIAQNQAVGSRDETACGGGIAAWYASDINISGGTIADNQSEGIGGGLSLGVSRVFHASPQLHMTGGSFRGNVAETCGGGLYVQGGQQEGYSRAYVSGGSFRDNTAKNGAFGGGGIYVNGGHDLSGFHSGELYLTNAIITENDAGESGGGYAACPTSQTVVRLKNGAAVYGNKAKTGREVHINASVIWHGKSAQPEYELAESMLGGAPYHWKVDDTSDKENGRELSHGRLHGKLASGKLNLANDVSEEGIAAAKELAAVEIIGNHAGKRGGGIGTNGDVYIGTGGQIAVHVKKIWKDNDNARGARPKSVRVGLYRQTEGSSGDPTYIGHEILRPDAEGKWETEFSRLADADAKGNYYVYTVREQLDEKDSLEYRSEVRGSVSGADGVIYLTNTYQEKEIQGKKIWKDQENREGIRPDQITVRLLSNGTEIAKKTVTAADGWRWSFGKLPLYENGEKIDYVVTEDALPDYSSERDGADLINHYTPGETSVTVTKAWEDNGNQDGIRPDHILVQLYADGKPVGKPEELNEAGKWSRTWDKLKQKAGKHIIRYTVTEVNVPEGYQSEITGTAETGYRIRNRHVPETRRVSVTKKWMDDGNRKGKRPDHVTIHLLADGKDTGKTLTLKKASGWKGSFQQLEKYREGKEVSYSISETKVKEYKSKIIGSAEKGFMVTNTLVEKKQKVKHQDSDKKNTSGKHTGNTSGTRNKNTSGTQSASKPKTGDTNRAAGYLILLGAALGVLGILQKKRKA